LWSRTVSETAINVENNSTTHAYQITGFGASIEGCPNIVINVASLSNGSALPNDFIYN
jgi:hypothetical protein